MHLTDRPLSLTTHWKHMGNEESTDAGVIVDEALPYRQGRTIRHQYTCQVCAKCFSRPSALQTHIYTHTGEKPHECTVPGCGRRFAVISNLRRHFKVHSKTASSQRLSAQDRQRYVQQLMERTAAEPDSSSNLSLCPGSPLELVSRDPIPLASERWHAPPVSMPTPSPSPSIPNKTPPPSSRATDPHARISIHQLLDFSKK